MNPILYYFPHSPPSRCVLLLAQIIGIAFDAHKIDISKGEQLLDSYRQINPVHTVPTIVDNGFTLWESRAIMTYLTDSYAQNDSMYPHDLKARALVDSRLQFDLGTLYPRMAKHYFADAGTPPDPQSWTKLMEALGFFNEMLLDRSWAAGDTYTLADLSLTVTMAHIESYGADLVGYSRVADWLTRSKGLLQPYKYNEIMLEALKAFTDSWNDKSSK